MNNYKLDNLEHLQKYLLGGKAEFIIENIKSTNHYTYFIKKKKDNIYYLFVIIHKPIYLGHFQYELGKNVFLSLQAKNTDNTNLKYYNLLISFLTFIYKENKIPQGIEIYYTGRCSVCNRVLTDPESINIGIGKYCLENYGKR